MRLENQINPEDFSRALSSMEAKLTRKTPLAMIAVEFMEIGNLSPKQEQEAQKTWAETMNDDEILTWLMKIQHEIEKLSAFDTNNQWIQNAIITYNTMLSQALSYLTEIGRLPTQFTVK